MRSMTGFGRGVAEHGGVRATVDLCSVNHRFLDLKMRGSLGPALEEQIAAKVRAVIERGAVTVSVNVAGAATATRIDRDAAKRAHAQLAALAAELGTEPPALGLILGQPGVQVAAETVDDAAILTATASALAQLDEMRATEGLALATELVARLDWLAQLRGRIAELAATVPAQQQKRLQDRLTKLGLVAGGRDGGGSAAEGQRGAIDVDPQRLAQEVAILADRADITEELVRLASHLEQARSLLAGSGAIGRRLDFLTQELGREINTIGSKSAAAEITAAVVEAKATLEKLREQVQNVE